MPSAACWQRLGACELGKLVDVGHLLGVGFIGGDEFADRRVGFLQIDIDECRFAAEAEALPGGPFLDLEVHLPRTLAGELHGWEPSLSSRYRWARLA